MEMMLEDTEQCLNELRKWMDAIIVHTMDESTRPVTMSPIVFVGTFKDKVRDAEKHKEISRVLADAFQKSSPAWLSGNIIKYQQINEVDELNFFPVDNTKGREDETVLHLMNALEATLERAESVNQQIPLTWLKCLDKVVANKQGWLSREEVEREALTLGISKSETVDFIRFMTQVSEYSSTFDVS